jgi:hypothetical protein
MILQKTLNNVHNHLFNLLQEDPKVVVRFSELVILRFSYIKNFNLIAKIAKQIWKERRFSNSGSKYSSLYSRSQYAQDTGNN